MGLFYIWIAFIFLMGISECDANHYYLFCASMFYATYLYNQIQPTGLTLKMSSIYLSIPSVILWWIVYVYNWFLREDPISDEIMIGIIFLYFYIFLYVYWECN